MPRTHEEQKTNSSKDPSRPPTPTTSLHKPSLSTKKPVPILRREPSPALFKKVPPSPEAPQTALLPSSDPLVRMWMVAQGMVIFSPKQKPASEDETIVTTSTGGSRSTLSQDQLTAPTPSWTSKFSCISGCQDDLKQSVTSFRDIPQFACGPLEEAYSSDSLLEEEDEDEWINQDIQVVKSKTPKTGNKNQPVVIRGDEAHGMSSRNCMRPRRVHFQEEPPKETATTPMRDSATHGDDVSEVTNFSADSWKRHNHPTKFPNAIRIDDDDDEEDEEDESTQYSRDLLSLSQAEDDPLDNLVQDQKSFWDPLF